MCGVTFQIYERMVNRDGFGDSMPGSLRGKKDLTKMVAEPWATNAAGRAGLEPLEIQVSPGIGDVASVDR
jgi:hypothetical protein